MTAKTLKNYESMLNKHIFIRPHQSHIINTQYIESYKHGRTGQIEMNCGTKIPVSRTRKKNFIKRLELIT